MSQHVAWWLELEIQSDEYKPLMEEMVEATQANEPGTLNYEWSAAADGSVCHIYERYADSEAAIIHLGTFGERFAARFLDVFKPIRLSLYGSPSPALQEVMAAFSPVHMQSVGGFHRE